MDILKDIVGSPGVSLNYLLCGLIKRGAELYSPRKEANQMLKGVVMEGPSIMHILSYDTPNLSIMLREMPCRKETDVHQQDSVQVALWLTQWLKDRT